MRFLRSIRGNENFSAGVRDMSPIAVGLAAWGVMTGVAMVNAGLSVTEALTMCLLVYAGSAQLAVTPLVVGGAPAIVILATAFCVNVRFLVFSLHMRPYLMHLPLWRRLVCGYLTADMTYALFTNRFPQPGLEPATRAAQESYLMATYAVGWTSWMACSIAGILLGNLIPPAWGLGFAGVLCVLGILCSLITTRLRLLAAAVASAVAVAAYALPLKLNIVVAIAAAVGATLWLERWRMPLAGETR